MWQIFVIALETFWLCQEGKICRPSTKQSNAQQVRGRNGVRRSPLLPLLHSQFSTRYPQRDFVAISVCCFTISSIVRTVRSSARRVRRRCDDQVRSSTRGSRKRPTVDVDTKRLALLPFSTYASTIDTTSTLYAQKKKYLSTRGEGHTSLLKSLNDSAISLDLYSFSSRRVCSAIATVSYSVCAPSGRGHYAHTASFGAYNIV